MPYKYKYLIVREKPYNMGKTMAIVDVAHLNKKGREQKWDELDEQYPKDKYTSCFTECQQEKYCFEEPVGKEVQND